MRRMTIHDDNLEPLEQALQALRRGLEEAESALLDFEAILGAQRREGAPEERGIGQGSDQGSSQLLSIAEVCQELAMGKSWVHRRIRSGEIPSVRLGRAIKVKRADLDAYLESRRYRPPQGPEAQEERAIG